MTDPMQARVWQVLDPAFAAIETKLRRHISSVTLSAGHSSNDAFAFRAYAEYAAFGHVLVLSFDVKKRPKKILLISGDLSEENGRVLEEIIDESVSETDHDAVVGHARTFAARCGQLVDLIKNHLQ